MAFNKTILVGNLVADPELKATPSGVNVTKFRIAVARRYAKADSEVKADFFDIVAWRATAEFVCKYFLKGNPILVSGALQNRNRTDNDGVKHYATEIIADEISFVGRKSDNASGQAEPNPVPTYGDIGDMEDLGDDEELIF